MVGGNNQVTKLWRKWRKISPRNCKRLNVHIHMYILMSLCNVGIPPPHFWVSETLNNSRKQEEYIRFFLFSLFLFQSEWGEKSKQHRLEKQHQHTFQLWCYTMSLVCIHVFFFLFHPGPWWGMVRNLVHYNVMKLLQITSICIHVLKLVQIMCSTVFFAYAHPSRSCHGFLHLRRSATYQQCENNK